MEKIEPGPVAPRWLIPAGIVLLVLTALGIGAYQAFRNPKPPRFLDTYGNQQLDTVDEKGKPAVKTIIHTIPAFSFVNQEGKTVTEKTVAGKTRVVDFFFTTCRSICPVMSRSVMKLVSETAGDTGLVFLSHTVDPEADSVPALRAYALAHQASPDRWHFLTGDKKALYYMARYGYLINAKEAEPGDGGPDDFIHSQNFVLVDKYNQIRGFYDGTDSTEMRKLLRDYALLKKEYSWNETQTENP